MPKKQISNLLNNSRFYVIAVSVVVSILIFCLLRITIADPRLRGIRLQQFYGLISILYWYAVLLMSAAAKVLPEKPWIKSVLFLRRPVGVMVAYFAALHTVVAFFDQLGGWGGLGQLPALFQWSLLLGSISLIVLLFMTALSVDKLVAVIGFKHWKQLQRLSYAAAVLVLIHIWIIGTHAAPGVMQLAALLLLALLFFFESLRFRKGLIKKNISISVSSLLAFGLFGLLMMGLIVVRLAIPSIMESHVEHEAGTEIHAH